MRPSRLRFAKRLRMAMGEFANGTSIATAAAESKPR
jgi:hypothetical protein